MLQSRRITPPCALQSGLLGPWLYPSPSLHICSDKCPYTPYTYAQTHMPRHMPRHPDTYAQTHAQTHAYSHAHTRAYMYAKTHAQAHSHTHSHTHMPMHVPDTHDHTHMTIHTCQQQKSGGPIDTASLFARAIMRTGQTQQSQPSHDFHRAQACA